MQIGLIGISACMYILMKFIICSDISPSIHDAASIDISLVVPAYNEELRLGVMMDETLAFIKDYAKGLKLTYEV